MDFGAIFVALYVGHSVGDHWVQTSHQAATKGLRNRAGRIACAAHVASLTATKAVLLAVAAIALGLELSAAGLALGLGIDAATHYWADRRFTLERLARAVGAGQFYGVGTSAHAHHPVSASGSPAAHLGTGAYALDQSWHHLWLFGAALIITAV